MVINTNGYVFPQRTQRTYHIRDILPSEDHLVEEFAHYLRMCTFSQTLLSEPTLSNYPHAERIHRTVAASHD